MSRRSLVTLFVLLALLVAVPAQAITNGEVDEGQHPNVGALVVNLPPFGDTVWCSGSLVAPNLYLTAAHCVTDNPSELTMVGVSFDPDPLANLGSAIQITQIDVHPGYPGPSSDPHDLAVITLADAVNISPVELPAVHLFDTLAKQKKNGLHGQKFTAVGYGSSGRVHEPGGGAPQFQFPDIRMNAVSTFRALTNAWLRLSMNPSHDDGGTCYGDSGGPNFLGAGNGETNIVAAITVTGDTPCRATNVVYRLDTASAQEFLSGLGIPSGANAKAKKTSAGKERAGGKRHHGRRR